MTTVMQKSLPLLDELVDTLNTRVLQRFIDEHVEHEEDRRSLFMFVSLFFWIKLTAPQFRSTEIKQWMTQIMRDQSSRQMFIHMFGHVSFPETRPLLTDGEKEKKRKVLAKWFDALEKERVCNEEDVATLKSVTELL